ncbi:MAG: DNA repair protein RadC [Elusimicrobia bacterium]|nr:DNA repair protein RadC [Candidatus Obscuribacterium magneticum]
METYEVSPKGHRERMRERFNKALTDGMHDYEVLELLLTYAIPRRDVKPIAKNLLQSFGGLPEVLEAPLDKLAEAPGMGRSSATLIRLVKELSGLYLGRRLERRDMLSSPEKVVDFARTKLAGLPHEAFMVLFLNTQNELIHSEVINEGTIDQVAVYPRRVVEKALSHHASGIILVHNHPSGYTDPSDEDKNLTRSIREAARLLDIRLLDHLVVGKAGYCSFLERGLM